VASTVSLVWGEPGSKLIVKDTWTLGDRGAVLSIQRFSSSPFMGEQNQTLVFDKR
jgi:hypothetical protein